VGFFEKWHGAPGGQSPMMSFVLGLHLLIVWLVVVMSIQSSLLPKSNPKTNRCAAEGQAVLV
jgi:hypothetical protein